MVGLVIFVIAYCVLMTGGIGFYCKYCKGGRVVAQGSKQSDTTGNQMILAQKSIEYEEQ